MTLIIKFHLSCNERKSFYFKPTFCDKNFILNSNIIAINESSRKK